MRSLVLLFLLGPCLGCGDSVPQGADMGGDDGKQIADLVDRLNDENNTIPRLKALFATGTPLGKTDTRKYPLYRYELKGKPTVNGDSATAKIDVILNSSSETAGEREWTFVKDGDKWKIKSAPLL